MTDADRLRHLPELVLRVLSGDLADIDAVVVDCKARELRIMSADVAVVTMDLDLDQAHWTIDPDGLLHWGRDGR